MLAALVFASGVASGLAAQDDVAELDPAATYLRIENIGKFLEQCPDRDANWSTIAADFALRRDGVRVGSLGCTEPISSLTATQYSDEIIVAQGLRVIYYMDRGQSGHLPWTSGTLYAWMASKIDGININSGGGSWCCSQFDGKTYINVGAQDDFNRMFDKRWRGISGNIGLYAHEARHVDGFPHVSCCGIVGGCDQEFDPGNLSPYGVQWWLDSLWLTGVINVGYECLSPAEISLTTEWHQSGVNSQFRSRFCERPPPLLLISPLPGGRCPEWPARVRPVRRP